MEPLSLEREVQYLGHLPGCNSACPTVRHGEGGRYTVRRKEQIAIMHGELLIEIDRKPGIAPHKLFRSRVLGEGE